MAEVTWEKSPENAAAAESRLRSRSRYSYLIIGGFLLAAVAYLMVTGVALGGRYYITVDELMADSSKHGRDVRVAGAVLGESIAYDQNTQTLSFTVVNIPNDNATIREQGGLGQVLHRAVNNPDATRMSVIWEHGEYPDLLQHEAQAIMTGRLEENPDGTFNFYATEVNLKCPTRYSDEVPDQAAETE